MNKVLLAVSSRSGFPFVNTGTESYGQSYLRGTYGHANNQLARGVSRVIHDAGTK